MNLLKKKTDKRNYSCPPSKGVVRSKMGWKQAKSIGWMVVARHLLSLPEVEYKGAFFNGYQNLTGRVR